MESAAPVTSRSAAAEDGAARPAPELSVIAPTFNERDNVAVLVDRLAAILDDCDWEVLFVDDDSPDGTAAVVRTLGERDCRVRCIRRIGRRGLAGACLEGMLASGARYLAVMDADLQHDVKVLAAMLAQLRSGRADLVVASRYIDGGSAAALSKRRARLSRWGNSLAQRLFGIKLSDPMSGFFMIRREAFEKLAPRLSSQGFKILLDLLATGGGRLRAVELPITFLPRHSGQSKLDSKIALDFAALITAKLTNDAVSARFLLFCLVGLSGIAIHLGVLRALLAVSLSFGLRQAAATVTAIAWNFALNNAFTYSDQRLSGWRFLAGLLRFEVICAVGAISNVGIATSIYEYGSKWWLAGLCGALVGAVWNFVVSATFVWR